MNTISVRSGAINEGLAKPNETVESTGSVNEGLAKPKDSGDSFEVKKEDGFFSKMKNLASSAANPVATSDMAFRAEGIDLKNFDMEIKGALVGGTAGAVIGGVVAYNSAMTEVNKQPIESVTLEWQKPVTQDKVIGKMPGDYYEPNNLWSAFNNHNTLVDVTREAPVLKDGVPVMEQTQKTFSDHGKLQVQWNQKPIQDPWLKGYSESKWEDGHYETVHVGHDSNGNDITEQRYEVDGWQHRFTADVQYKKVGEFKEPQVTFETGVNVGMKTFEGILLGLGLGAVSGAIAAAALKKVMENQGKA